MVFFIAYIVFIILTFVYGGKSLDDTEKIQCASAKLPKDLVDGTITTADDPA